MSTEDVSATPLPEEAASADPIDEIASLLAGESDESSEEGNEEETPLEASNEEEESNEEEASEEGSETDLEAIAEEDDQTWESVLGVDEGKLHYDDEGNIAGVNVKVDGESSTIDMNDLIAGYQTNKSVTQRSQGLAEERKAFDSEKGQVEQIYRSKLDTVDMLTQHLEKRLIGDFENINWEQLRLEDPAEYAALRQDYSTKASELQNIKSAIQTDSDSQKGEIDGQNQQKHQEYMKGQFAKMVENNPAWQDDDVRVSDMKGYKTFLNETYGFTDQEFDTVFDARIIELMKDAKKFREGSKVAANKIKKPVPKFQKSRGKQTKKSTSKLDKLTAASKKAHGAQKRELQQSAVAELLTGAI